MGWSRQKQAAKVSLWPSSSTPPTHPTQGKGKAHTKSTTFRGCFQNSQQLMEENMRRRTSTVKKAMETYSTMSLPRQQQQHRQP